MPRISMAYRTSRTTVKNLVETKQNKTNNLFLKSIPSNSLVDNCRGECVLLLMIGMGGPSPLWAVPHWEGHPGL